VTEKKPAGPSLGPKPSPKVAKQQEVPPEQKAEFTQLRPSGMEGHPREDAASKVGAIQHQIEAAAAKAEDRANDPNEPDDDGSEDALNAMVNKFVNQFQADEQLMTPEQKELIEKRLEPIDLSQMFIEQEFRQVVPIIPGKFEVEYRSISGYEDEHLKLMLSDEPENVSTRYLGDKYATLSLICAVRVLNGKELPLHYTPQKGWDDKNFEKRGKLVMGLPATAVWSLMVHATWFDQRCKGLFKVSEIKNG